MPFSDNKNQQILQALLKAHGVKKVVASPGGTNPAMVMSFQLDSDFELFSCVDERSAAYIACGIAEESGEAVAICCTGATASRNYYPALTEAFYRKLPIVVITCSRPNYYMGHLFPQVTNRTEYPKDIFVDGEQIQHVKDENDAWDVHFKINKGLLAMRHLGGGPVHFNVECQSQACTTPQLPIIKAIKRIVVLDKYPEINENKVGIFIGSHKKMSYELIDSIDKFCEKYNAVVFCDHTSGYYGKYSIPFSLLGTQNNKREDLFHIPLLIHLGEISGDYLTMESIKADKVWRICEDGEPRIRFKTLDYLFEMKDLDFFTKYTDSCLNSKLDFFHNCERAYNELLNSIPELPLSLIYIAKLLSPQMPHNCTIHFSIVNALRAWNFFKLDPSIHTNCNVGGFGIDGCTSSFIGASLVNKNKLYFLFTGDLAFFYDLNVIGNRHIGNNVRILLLNDGKGAEFTHYRAAKFEGPVDDYIAGSGHFGNQSHELVKNFAVNLGFDYIQATDKECFLSQYKTFINPEISEKPILFEVITTTQGQSDSWKLLSELSYEKEEKVTTFDKIKKIFRR